MNLSRREATKGKIVELFHVKVYPFPLLVFTKNVLAEADLLLCRSSIRPRFVKCNTLEPFKKIKTVCNNNIYLAKTAFDYSY